MTEFAFQSTPFISVDTSTIPTDVFPGNDVSSEITVQQPEFPAEVNPVSQWEQASFYVREANAVNDSPMDDYFYVDITIQIANDGKCGIVTKRLKFNKGSLIGEMKATDEIKSIKATIVENKQVEKSATQRMLELSGIKHPKNFV